MTPEERLTVFALIDHVGEESPDLEIPLVALPNLKTNANKPHAIWGEKHITEKADRWAARAREIAYMQTWRGRITKEMMNHGDSWSDLEGSTITDWNLDDTDAAFEFDPDDDDMPQPFAIPFTLWTTERVYFPVHRPDKDGGMFCGSAPRNPKEDATLINPYE